MIFGSLRAGRRHGRDLAAVGHHRRLVAGHRGADHHRRHQRPHRGREHRHQADQTHRPRLPQSSATTKPVSCSAAPPDARREHLDQPGHLVSVVSGRKWVPHFDKSKAAPRTGKCGPHNSGKAVSTNQLGRHPAAKHSRRGHCSTGSSLFTFYCAPSVVIDLDGDCFRFRAHHASDGQLRRTSGAANRYAERRLGGGAFR